MYAVAVTFKLKPDCCKAFLPLMQENARTSLAVEPGCQQFDICLDEVAETVFLYEIYDDRAAFDAHLESAHFKSFDGATKDMVAEKVVCLYSEVIR